MLPWWDQPANPMSMHAEGRAAAAALDRARGQVAEACGFSREEVFFTSGATEANNWLLSKGKWAVTAVEHPSVLGRGAIRLPVDENGVAQPSMAPELEGFDGVSVMLANNETGVIQPVAEWSEWCRRKKLRFHVDASQGPGRIATKISADYLTLSAHKAGGPTGVGALLARRGIWPEALLVGGPQERNRRAGTHALPAIVGFGAVMEARGEGSPVARDALEARLLALGGKVAGGGASRLPNTCCVGFGGIDAQDLVVALDLEGIAVSAGSACASGSPEPSHVLKAMGFRGSAVRFSLGPENTVAEMVEVARVVERVVGRLR